MVRKNHHQTWYTVGPTDGHDHYISDTKIEYLTKYYVRISLTRHIGQRIKIPTISLQRFPTRMLNSDNLCLNRQITYTIYVFQWRVRHLAQPLQHALNNDFIHGLQSDCDDANELPWNHEPIPPSRRTRYSQHHHPWCLPWYVSKGLRRHRQYTSIDGRFVPTPQNASHSDICSTFSGTS